MTYASVQDIASTWEQYERVTAGLLDPPPEGLIMHLAGPTDEGFRMIEIWESEQAWERFRVERLTPAIAALGGPARPEPTFRDLHASHLVFGSIKTTAAAERQRSTLIRRRTLTQQNDGHENH